MTECPRPPTGSCHSKQAPHAQPWTLSCEHLCRHLQGLAIAAPLVGRLLRSGLGDAAIVRNTSYRVNSKEGPNPAKWSPIRPSIRRREGMFQFGNVRGDKGKPWPSVVTA